MASTKIDLEKFNGKNDFNMWKVKMEAVLITQDYVIREVAKEPTVADLWAKLESIYMKKSLANRLYIKKRMLTLKMPEGSSLDEHLDEFNKVCDILETIDASLSDEDKALLLISFFPKSYEHFVDALMYGRQTLSLDEVKSALSTKELQGKQESLGNGSEGHFKTNCPEKKFQKKGKDGDAAVVEEERYESASVCVATESRDRDHSVNIESDEMMIIKGTETIMKGLKKNEVFVLDGEVVTGEAGLSVNANIDKARLWHLRLGHIGSCVLGKATRASFNRSVHKSKDKLEYVHFDSWGPAQQNGLAEMMNMTLMERVRSMLVQSKLLKTLWAEILLTACHLVNLSPSTTIDFKTTYEKWTGEPANYRNLRAFGCPAYAHTSQGKLAPRALKVFFIGYPERVKGYNIWCTDLSPPRCIISRDVTFNEIELLNQKSAQQQTEEGTETVIKQQFEVEFPKSDDSLEATDSGGVTDNSGDSEIPQQEQESQEHEQGCQLTSNRAKRQIKQTRRYGYADLISYALAAAYQNDEDEPKSYKETEGVDFKEVFSPVVRHASIRVILALTTVQDMELDQLDVKTAFLHGRLQEEIFMTQPEGFDEFMITNGFMTRNYDCCVYFKLLEDDHYIYLLLYVDDMLIACKWREEKEKLKVMETYKMLDSKPVLTPLAAHFKLSNQLCPKTDEEKLDMKNVPYVNTVGCLIRSRGRGNGLLGFVDSDYAGDLDRRRSLTGFMFMYEGCFINWKATLQYVVALSTTEAEYTAAAEAVKEALGQ
ncbi:hypothetical protein KPL71_014247 [Citrus sinensis]|uniref:Uncharacterized protein n=1 Tax=Citrus sinensis TaxID=2711 RepID=A0ACB8KAI8_CITSI|nr:hypothetical protein KPL71_014247 [Citrus sinensis]